MFIFSNIIISSTAYALPLSLSKEPVKEPLTLLSALKFKETWFLGAFFITVMCSCLISTPRPLFEDKSIFLSITINLVWVFVLGVPCWQSLTFIFLGSESLSVQSNKSSIIFILNSLQLIYLIIETLLSGGWIFILNKRE